MEVSTFNGGEEGEEEPLDGITWFSSYFMVRCFAFVHPPPRTTMVAAGQMS